MRFELHLNYTFVNQTKQAKFLIVNAFMKWNAHHSLQTLRISASFPSRRRMLLLLSSGWRSCTSLAEPSADYTCFWSDKVKQTRESIYCTHLTSNSIYVYIRLYAYTFICIHFKLRSFHLCTKRSFPLCRLSWTIADCKLVFADFLTRKLNLCLIEKRQSEAMPGNIKAFFWRQWSV